MLPITTSWVAEVYVTSNTTSAATTDGVLERVDLSGQTIVVTGASSGLGEETSRALSAAGAQVVMAVRDGGRGGAAPRRIRARHPAARLDMHDLDLGSIASARASADA